LLFRPIFDVLMMANVFSTMRLTAAKNSGTGHTAVCAPRCKIDAGAVFSFGNAVHQLKGIYHDH
jgi:hypothetical protein